MYCGHLTKLKFPLLSYLCKGEENIKSLPNVYISLFRRQRHDLSVSFAVKFNFNCDDLAKGGTY